MVTTKKALLVGINDYEYIRQLRGCVNDVNAIRDLLIERCGFVDKDILLITDSKATKTAIMAGLEWLLKDTGDNNTEERDQILFYYSGHGLQLPTINCEPDGLDELICPYDFDWETKENTIRDGELSGFFSNNLSENVDLLWISDSCYSADLDDKPIDLVSEGSKVTLNRVIIDQIPKEIQDQVSRIKRGDFKVSRFQSQVAELNSKGKGIIFWGACQSDKLAKEDKFYDRIHGVFTYFLLKEIQEQGSVPIDVLQAKIAKNLSLFDQTPVLDGLEPEQLKSKTFLDVKNLPKEDESYPNGDESYQYVDAYRIYLIKLKNSLNSINIECVSLKPVEDFIAASSLFVSREWGDGATEGIRSGCKSPSNGDCRGLGLYPLDPAFIEGLKCFPDDNPKTKW